ncbi:MAG: histidine kinase [Gammaproteobacteria bacterium]|nr:histidine kinase [Gammaproteobacteria bacterium]
MSEDGMPAVYPPKPRLLFVEDEATLRDHLAERLSDEYVVDTAGNGNEALLAVMRAKPALVVTDIVMPDMDGVELLKTLRQTPNTRGIPVLLISGRAADEHRIEGFEQGADGFLAKPYTERELRALIGSMLRSARLRAEAAGRDAREEAEQRAVIERSALLESITDAFYALDRQWRFTYVNQRALGFYGMQRAELLGRSFWEVFPAAKGSALEEQYERALRQQRSVSFETLSPSTGSWVEVRAYPTPQGLAVNFRDIGKHKQIEKELKHALAELHGREEQLSEFLAILAHELRNPLAPVRNGLQILRLRASADELSQRTVNMMDRQVSHLVHLVDDLLDVSRITRGTIALKREKILLTDVLASAVEASRPMIEAHAHELVIDVRPTVPIVIDGDPRRLAQVFSNLLSNSAKYMDRGGTITLTLDCLRAEAVVSVRDTGIGIAPDALGRVFEMFSQVRPDDARSDGGLGIGLSLVRTLTQLHGGSVSASSQGPGTGSVFTVRLPVVQQQLAASVAAADIAPHSPVESPHHCVLVVDDNRDAAASLALLLQMCGHEVHTAADGEEAIKRAQQVHPNIIFMDLGMPRMNGIEATRRIRALPQGQGINIIALTGWAQESDHERTHGAGMDFHLVKPVSSEALQDVLDQANAKHRSADAGKGRAGQRPGE